MEKTDKSAAQDLAAKEWNDSFDYRSLRNGVQVGNIKMIHLDGVNKRAMDIYAAKQLSEYKEYFELVEKAKQVLRDKGYGWTGLDILETCKLVPKAEPPEENQLAPPQESEQP